ncbi:hypothetical protein DLH72_05040 [Candidatus Gracilibacteria bacterium]|nr:MAG: hypothetical protein DLH72_05040 [Candidatus Gracilibacteria bacterium]
MINKEALHNLVHSQGWKEFKKIIEEKRFDLSKKIIDKPEGEWKNEILKIKTMEEMIKIPENIVKNEILKKRELSSLGEIPSGLK